MRILKVSTSGMDYVLEMARLSKPTEDIRYKLENPGDILNRASVTFHITELSIIEAFWMHHYAPKFKLRGFVFNDEPFSIEKYPDSGTSISKLIKVVNAIESDADFDSKYIGLAVMPGICIESDVMVTFYGPSLLRLFEAPVETFIARTIEMNLEEDWFTKENIELARERMDNMLVQNFVTGFYKHVADSLSKTPIVEGLITQRLEYNDPAILVGLTTPYGGVNFTESSPKSVNFLKEIMKQGKSDGIIDNIYTFSIYAPLEIMITLDLIYDDVEVFGCPNLNTIIGNLMTGRLSHEEILNLYEEDNLHKAYHIRFLRGILGYIDNITGNIAKTEKILAPCMLPMNTMVHFSINVSGSIKEKELVGLNFSYLKNICKTVNRSVNMIENF